MPLDDPRLEAFQVALWLKRDDLKDPHLGGNKGRKLKYNLAAAKAWGYRSLATFGGPHSNHLRAVAAAGQAQGFATFGAVRGEGRETPTLAVAKAFGMVLTFWDRRRYRSRGDPAAGRAWVAELEARYPHRAPIYLLPEGGSNRLALLGCGEIVAELQDQLPHYHYLACACGTGGTLAGIAKGLPPGRRALGVAVLKGGDFLHDAVGDLLGSDDPCNWAIDTQHHGGGYAKCPPALLAFMAEFEDRFGIPLDFVYTGKLLYALYRRIQRGDFPPQTTIVALHTGGVASASLATLTRDTPQPRRDIPDHNPSPHL